MKKPEQKSSDQAAWDAGVEDAHMQDAVPMLLAANKKFRVAVLQERKRFADTLDGINGTQSLSLILPAIAEHNLAMRKLEADHHKKLGSILAAPKIPCPFVKPASAAKPKAKKQTAAKFFAAKAKKVAKKKPAAKKAAKRKR